MKKLLISAIAALLIAMSFASCYDPLSATSQKNTTASDATTAEEAKKAKKIKAEDYEKTFTGLCDYMKDSGFITVDENNANVVKMNVKLIGAKKGLKYTMGNVRIELYAFDLKGENKTRDKILDSVKKDGTYTLYSQVIPAYLAEDGMFMMIYANPDIHEGDTTSDAYLNMQKAIKAFEKF